MENYAVSLINLYKPYSLFDLKGVIVSSQSTLLKVIKQMINWQTCFGRLYAVKEAAI